MIKLTNQSYILPSICENASQYTTAEDAIERRKKEKRTAYHRYSSQLSSPAARAMVEAQMKHDASEIGLSEVYMCIQLALNLHAMDHAYNLCRMVIDSRTDEGRSNKGLHFDYGQKGAAAIARTILQELDRQNAIITKEIKYQSEEGTEQDSIMLYTDRMSAADDKIDPFEERIENFLLRHIPTSGDCSPLDEKILLEMMQSLVWMQTASDTFRHGKKTELVCFRKERLVRCFNIDHIFRHIGRLQRCINIVNHKLRPLRYNINGVLYHTDLIGKLNPKSGRMEGGLLNNLIFRVFSTRFIDYVLLKSDGIDYHLRDHTNSLLKNMPQDYTIRDTEFNQSSD